VDDHPQGKTLHALCSGCIWLANVRPAQATVDAVVVAYIPRQQVTYIISADESCVMHN